MKRIIVGAAVALLLAGCAGEPPWSAPAATPTPRPTRATTPAPAATRGFGPSDWRLDVDVLGKQCFGSAGCNVTFQIDPTWVAADPLPTSGSIRVTYRVDGAESELIGTFETSGEQATIREHTVSTANESDVLTATPTKVIYTGPAVTAPASTSGRWLPLRADSTDHVVAAIEGAGVRCPSWSRMDNWHAFCDEPKVMAFYDPLAPGKQDLMESTSDLYKAIFVGKGGMVFKGENWIIGAMAPASQAILQASLKSD